MGGIEPTHVRLDGVGKRFGGATALTDVSLSIPRGSVRGLVGENGAGKSTLGRVIAGAVRPDQGIIEVDGRSVRYRSPREALADGVTMMAQELSLLPKRSVLDNVFLGFETRTLGVIRQSELRERFATLTEQTSFDVPGDARLGDLRVADQQKVEIMRALARNARLIVMDEPTAALTGSEADHLFEVVRRLSTAGVTIVYVSHHLAEVLALVDEVTVMRNGRVVRTAAAGDETPHSLVSAMLGQSLDEAVPDKAPPATAAPVALSVRKIRRPGVVEDVGLDLREGEILGLAGLVGSGRSEVARAIFGADPAGDMTLEVAGERVNVRGPRDAIEAGIGFVPEDRKRMGLFMSRTVTDNIALPHMRTLASRGIVSPGRERRVVGSMLERVNVTGGDRGSRVSTLSGGNQQKVLFGKWLAGNPRIVIVDEPTRGVDVGAKRAIHQTLVDLAADGMAVLLISSEVEEVVGLAHRVLVMKAGMVVAELVGDEITEERVTRASFGDVGGRAG